MTQRKVVSFALVIFGAIVCLWPTLASDEGGFVLIVYPNLLIGIALMAGGFFFGARDYLPRTIGLCGFLLFIGIKTFEHSYNFRTHSPTSDPGIAIAALFVLAALACLFIPADRLGYTPKENLK